MIIFRSIDQQTPRHQPQFTTQALFAKRLPDPRGCILAVCLRKEKEPEAGEENEGYDDGSQALRELVCGCV